MRPPLAPMIAAGLLAGLSALAWAAEPMPMEGTPGTTGHDMSGHAMGSAMTEHMGQDGIRAADTAAMPLTDGQVKKVDQAAGRVTLAHGPLPDGMPAMTMPYRVADAAWLDDLKSGQTIRFAAREVDGVWTIVRMEPSAP